MWRAFSILILAFWAIMTTLLVRFTWFPEGSQFAEVPPRVVLKQFLEQGSALSTTSTFHLYQRERKIGHASLSCRRIRMLVGAPDADFSVRLDGVIEKGTLGTLDQNVSFGADLKLRDVLRFAGAKGHVRMEKDRIVTAFTWPEGAARPSLVQKRDGVVLVDDRMLQPMLEQMIGSGRLGQMAGELGVAPSTAVNSLFDLRARESVKVFAGQKSKGYTLELSLMDRWKARAFFTEAGELALVDLPEGYRLVEPVIHGLAPDYDEEEQGGTEE